MGSKGHGIFFLFVSHRAEVTGSASCDVDLVLSLSFFLLFSGRFYKRDFHKSEKVCGFRFRLHMFIPMGGSVFFQRAKSAVSAYGCMGTGVTS